MADRQDIHPSVLRQILKYDPETGLVEWRFRDRSLCKDDRAWKIWNTRFAGKPAGRVGTGGYLYVTIFGRVHLLHRVIMAMINDEWPNCVDHINGVRTDNRSSNLRSVNNVENARNQKRSRVNTSGVTGVGWSRSDKRWWAAIKVDYRRINLGLFRDFDEAVAARRMAEIKYRFHENHGKRS